MLNEIEREANNLNPRYFHLHGGEKLKIRWEIELVPLPFMGKKKGRSGLMFHQLSLRKGT